MRAVTSVMHAQTAASRLLSKVSFHWHVVFSVWLALSMLAGVDNWTVAGEELLNCEVAVSFWLSGGFGEVVVG